MGESWIVAIMRGKCLVTTAIPRMHVYFHQRDSTYAQLTRGKM